MAEKKTLKQEISHLLHHEEDTQQVSVVKPDPDHPTVQGFAVRLEGLMNEAVQQSIPFPNQQATEHHQRFAHWANHLGDLWREVKQHV